MSEQNGKPWVEVYPRDDEKWGWRLWNGNTINPEILAGDNDNGFTRRADAERGAADAINAAVEVQGGEHGHS